MLDDLDFIKKIDREGMLNIYASYPEHFEKAEKLAKGALEKASLPPSFLQNEIRNIVVAGMGGSAISGDIVREIYFNNGHIPIYVNRSYRLPAYVDERTLLFVMSYSGNTYETLRCYRDGVKKGANVVGVSSGGKLEEMCKENGHIHVKIPSGIPPRAALPYLLLPQIVFLNTLNVGDEIKLDFLWKLKEYLSSLLPSTKEKKNIAKQIANEMKEKIIFLYGPSSFAPSLRRFSTQINENTESHAFWNVFPELCHNEIVAWSNTTLKNEKFILLFREPEREEEMLTRQMELSLALVLGKKAQVFEVIFKEKNHFFNLLYSIILGDMVSIYLAILRKVDPTPVKIIENIKKKMKKDGVW